MVAVGGDEEEVCCVGRMCEQMSDVEPSPPLVIFCRDWGLNDLYQLRCVALVRWQKRELQQDRQ